jgi:hypothetical protein
LEEKPQLSGSLVTPAMHEPDNELAGSAQFVKSARIWLIAFEFALPHMSLAVMDCSLSAYSAYNQGQQPRVRLQPWERLTQVLAHNGRVASPVRPQAEMEF